MSVMILLINTTLLFKPFQICSDMYSNMFRYVTKRLRLDRNKKINVKHYLTTVKTHIHLNILHSIHFYYVRYLSGFTSLNIVMYI